MTTAPIACIRPGWPVPHSWPPSYSPTPIALGSRALLLTVSNWHNVTRDAHRRPAGYGGYRVGHAMATVFAYDIPQQVEIAGANAIGKAAPTSRGPRR